MLIVWAVYDRMSFGYKWKLISNNKILFFSSYWFFEYDKGVIYLWMK